MFITLIPITTNSEIATGAEDEADHWQTKTSILRGRTVSARFQIVCSYTWARALITSDGRALQCPTSRESLRLITPPYIDNNLMARQTDSPFSVVVCFLLFVRDYLTLANFLLPFSPQSLVSVTNNRHGEHPSLQCPCVEASLCSRKALTTAVKVDQRARDQDPRPRNSDNHCGRCTCKP